LSKIRKRVYDEAFKGMAVSLSEAKESVKAAAEELGIDPGRISKWKHQHKGSGNSSSLPVGLSEEQKKIRPL